MAISDFFRGSEEKIGTDVYNMRASVLLVGHGADDVDCFFQRAEELRREKKFTEVQICFWKREPYFDDMLAAVESPKIFIVPMFVSRGVFTDEILPQKLESFCQGKQIVVCEPVGTHPDMARIVLSQAQTAMKNDKIDFQQTSLLLVSHGSEKNEQAAVVAREQAERIRALKIYGECRALFMAQEPFVRDWARYARLPNVVVVPFFMANGKHVKEDIPALLGIPAGLLNRFFETRNKRLWVAESLGGSPLLLNVILARIKNV